MPRRGQISKRDVLPDPLYGSKLVTKLINNVMYDGKKGVAQKIVYDAFATIEAKSGENALDVFVTCPVYVTTSFAVRSIHRVLQTVSRAAPSTEQSVLRSKRYTWDGMC